MRILFFAHLKDITGCAQTDLAADNIDTPELWRRLIATYPGLAPQQSQVRLARNCDFATADTHFYSGDEVALIPPVSGG
ncbi:MAG: MoaD/ThiS family protein [Opitutaceae bacterium]|nr:MoaD/ThiS family protein [Opitutaceae bacterium]